MSSASASMKRLKPPSGVLVFGPGNRDVRLLANLSIGVDAVGHRDLFEPARLTILDRGGQFDDVVNVHRLPAVEHDVVAFADCVP